MHACKALTTADRLAQPHKSRTRACKAPTHEAFIAADRPV